MGGSVLIKGYDLVKGTIDLNCDRVHKSLIVIDCIHRETHEGHHFFVNHSATLSAGESLIIRFETGEEKDMHAVFNAFASAGSTLNLYESTTLQHNESNVLNRQNYNRRLDSPSVMVNICHTPSGTEIRSPFKTYRVGADKQSSTERREMEFVLLHNTAYAVKITADSNGTEVVLDVDWYEAEIIDAVNIPVLD